MTDFTRRLFILILIGLPLTGIAQEQNDSRLNYVMSQVKKINRNLASAEAVKLLPSGSISDGSETIIFKRGDTIDKIVADHFSDEGKVSTELYYDETGIIYAYSEKITYNRSIDEQSAGDERESFDIQRSATDKDQHFFKDKKMIQWLHNQSIVPTDETPRFSIRESYLLELSQDLITQLQSQVTK